MKERLPRAIFPLKVPWIAEGVLTEPWEGRRTVICTDKCDECPLSKLGCALKCTRFPDRVCESCPCRSSKFVGEINDP